MTVCSFSSINLAESLFGQTILKSGESTPSQKEAVGLFFAYLTYFRIQRYHKCPSRSGRLANLRSWHNRHSEHICLKGNNRTVCCKFSSNRSQLKKKSSLVFTSHKTWQLAYCKIQNQNYFFSFNATQKERDIYIFDFTQRSSYCKLREKTFSGEWTLEK